MSDSSILETISRHRENNETVVFTNGCFDILHIGHLRYLSSAKSLGDKLVVGLNSDSSVMRLKGDSRPIIPENNRREMLLGLKPVDYVLLFRDDTPLELIKQVKPDILVKGGDWEVEQIVGHDFVTSYGGKVQSLQFEEGNSSSSIIARILA